MLFPMYTVASDVLLKMTKVEPHEELKASEPRALVNPQRIGPSSILYLFHSAERPLSNYRVSSVLRRRLFPAS